MAVPVMTNIYPSSGHTGGGTLIRMLGGDFGASIRVTVGGAECENVVRVNHALAYAVTPITPLYDAQTGEGTGQVDVVLTNLDGDGDPVPGETVTFTNGFEYLAPKLSEESTLQRTVRALMVEMRRQIIPNVVRHRHTDFAGPDDVTAGHIQVSELPVIVLVGPTILRDDYHMTCSPVIVQGEYFNVKRRPSYAGTLQFSLIGGAALQKQDLALEESVIKFFHKNGFLKLQRDPNDASKGFVEYDLYFSPGGLPAVITGPNESNVSSFTGTVEIGGVLIDGFTSLDVVPESDMVMQVVGPPPTEETFTIEFEQSGEGAPPVDTSLPNESVGAVGLPGAYEPRRWR